MAEAAQHNKTAIQRIFLKDVSSKRQTLQITFQKE